MSRHIFISHIFLFDRVPGFPDIQQYDGSDWYTRFQYSLVWPMVR